MKETEKLRIYKLERLRRNNEKQCEVKSWNIKKYTREKLMKFK